jgi:hypothetical protein
MWRAGKSENTNLTAGTRAGGRPWPENDRYGGDRSVSRLEEKFWYVAETDLVVTSRVLALVREKSRRVVNG